MALTRSQLIAGDGTQGFVLPGQVQGVTAGTGVTISPTGALSINTADPAFNAFMRTNSVGAFNGYVWPSSAGAVGQQLTLAPGNNLVWSDSDGIPWTTKGQLVVGTGIGTDILLNAGTDTAVLMADASTASGLIYSSASTAAIQVPAGTSLEQPATPALGQLRYNTDNDEFEGYLGSPAAWAPIGVALDPATLAEAAAGVITTKYSSPETAVPKDAAGMTGAALLPSGTSLQQPATPVDGMFRFNTTNDAFEGYGQNATAWEPLMPTGPSTDKTIYLNNQTITANYTIPAAPILKNGLSAGPITVAAGFTVTVPLGQSWSIV